MDKIILENFKILKGEQIFELRDLNIFTGPNNAGKSTLLKAMSLFAKGIQKGDFPSLNLFETRSGEFNELVNWDSGANSFKIGFSLLVGKKHDASFKIMYEFVDGEKYIEYGKGKAIFSNFEIFDEDGEFFFGAYSAETFKITKENIEYEFDWDNSKQRPETPFKCALEGSSPPILFLKFDINNLKKNLHLFTRKKYHKLFKRVTTLHKHNNWWIGRFLEADFSITGLSNLTFNDVINDFLENSFYELMDYESSKKIHWGKLKEEQNKILKEYFKMIKDIEYKTFIEKDVVFPLFKSIANALTPFRKENFIHIGYENFSQRLFSGDKENDTIIDIFQKTDLESLYGFSRKAFEIFGIDTYIEMKSHLNAALEINLVTGLDEIDKKSNNNK